MAKSNHKPIIKSEYEYLHYDAEMLESEMLEAAIAAVEQGMPCDTAAKGYGVAESTLRDHVHHLEHKMKSLLVLKPNEEQIITDFIQQLVQWGYDLDTFDIKLLIKGYLEACDEIAIHFKDNLPETSFIRSFIERNNLNHCLSHNIKPFDTVMRQKRMAQFFNHLQAIGDILPQNIFHYDEIALSNDPQAKTVITRRSTRRVLSAKEGHNMNISIMVCGSATGQFLPPLICYKSSYLVKKWTNAGPTGAVYTATTTGLLDMQAFAFWFERILLETVKQNSEQKLVIGNYPGHYFTPKVINLALENNIQFTDLPKGCTPIQRPLGIAMYKFLQNEWKTILSNYQKETNKIEPVSMQQLAMLLSQLWLKVGQQADTHLQEAFRANGIYPRNPTPSKKITQKQDPPKDVETIGKAIDAVLIDLLRNSRYQ